MKTIKRAAAALCLGAMAAFPLAARADEDSSLGAVESVSIAVDAYITQDRTVQVYSTVNAIAPSARHEKGQAEAIDGSL